MWQQEDDEDMISLADVLEFEEEQMGGELPQTGSQVYILSEFYSRELERALSTNPHMWS